MLLSPGLYYIFVYIFCSVLDFYLYEGKISTQVKKNPVKMSHFPKLNFPDYSFRLKSCDGADKVWDDIRKVWLVLTPEEWVRRHAVCWLVKERGVMPQMIAQEYPVDVYGQPQRADVVVFGRDSLPMLLVECKEPGVGMSGEVYAQAVRYNAVLGARYIMITNGLRHYVYAGDGNGGYTPLKIFPDLSERSE